MPPINPALLPLSSAVGRVPNAELELALVLHVRPYLQSESRLHVSAVWDPTPDVHTHTPAQVIGNVGAGVGVAPAAVGAEVDPPAGTQVHVLIAFEQARASPHFLSMRVGPLQKASAHTQESARVVRSVAQAMTMARRRIYLLLNDWIRFNERPRSSLRPRRPVRVNRILFGQSVPYSRGPN